MTNFSLFRKVLYDDDGDVYGTEKNVGILDKVLLKDWKSVSVKYEFNIENIKN